MAIVYSCCFWFSLRLGGILIGLVSIIQATLALIVFCIAYKRPQNIKYEISMMMKNINLVYVSGYLENIQEDPEKYISYCITLCSIYIIICVIYIYGAYMCNNYLMIVYILVELVRLIALSIFVTTWLIVLKQNTMDIGLVIGASVASGFVLLGMFYLWVCAATLPILINEMEQDEQKAKINKLERLLESKKLNFKRYSSFEDNEDTTGLFVLPKYKYAGEKIPDNYYASSFMH